jgi:AcrR family transcriptional regulator
MTNICAELDRSPATAESAAACSRGDGSANAAIEAGRGLVVGRGDAIVAAAYELITEFGLDGLSVRAVLKKTGLNRRSFYERFSGKDDLILAVFEQSLQALAAQCRQLIAAKTDPLERLRYIVDHLVLGIPADSIDPARGFRRGAALCREHMRLAEARPDELRVALRPLIALLGEQLAAGVASGQVRDRPPERLAALVYNLVSTTVHAAVLAEEAGANPTDRGRLAEDIWEFCLGGISP